MATRISESETHTPTVHQAAPAAAPAAPASPSPLDELRAAATELLDLLDTYGVVARYSNDLRVGPVLGRLKAALAK